MKSQFFIQPGVIYYTTKVPSPQIILESIETSIQQLNTTTQKWIESGVLEVIEDSQPKAYGIKKLITIKTSFCWTHQEAYTYRITSEVIFVPL